MTKNPVEKCLVLDLDGVIVYQHHKQPPTAAIPGASEWIKARKAEGWYIKIYTARSPEERNGVLRILENNGIVYDELEMRKPSTFHTVYIDDRPIKAITIKTNDGIASLDPAELRIQ